MFYEQIFFKVFSGSLLDSTPYHLLPLYFFVFTVFPPTSRLVLALFEQLVL
jgi:hypothetical protein